MSPSILNPYSSTCLAEVEVRARLAVVPVPRVDLLVAVGARRQELGHVRVAQVVQHLHASHKRTITETKEEDRRTK